jgi:SAM-dependent methyltransferase
VPNAINLDRIAYVGPDVVHDLDHTPWPFPDRQFSEVLAYDVLEHCHDFISAIEEIHRICRAGAIVRITVPHFSSMNAFTDPTHRRFFGWRSFDYVTGDHEFSFYTLQRFRRRTRQLIFFPTLINRLVRRMANRYPHEYERRWAWIFPAWFLYFELEAIK